MILTDENVGGHPRGSTRKSITKNSRTDLRRGSGNYESIWKSPSAKRRKLRRLLNKKCACDCVSGRGLSDWEHSRLRLSHPTISSTPSPTRLIPLMLAPPPWSSEAPRPHTPDTSSTVRRQRQRPCALGTSAKRGTSGRPFGTRHLELCSLSFSLSLGVHPRIYSMFSTCHVYPRQHLFLFFPNLIPLFSLPRSTCRERNLMAPPNSRRRARVYILLLLLLVLLLLLLLLAAKQLQHRSVIWIMLQKFSNSKRSDIEWHGFYSKYTGNLNDSLRTVVT